ncbi:hypothetical protein C0W92_09385 [Photobacterium angustum]|uniref:hypothetical protein n=1 Tax=Photobacterium angustum TaxID=661 RepID=UPI0005E9629B|nr:hypothetical protein [Photobacterium angustum]KJG31196.1 hypothetical protein UA69_09100 [Photobacterium angustum]PSW90231.1 hypothetical protein C0W92_09385 [Photobacterium angustum]
MKFKDRLFNGLDSSVQQNWLYQESILNVNTEYMYKVAIAQELMKGFYHHSGDDFTIELDQNKKRIPYAIVSEEVTLNKKFKKKTKSWKKDYKVDGRVDIFLSNDKSKDTFIIDVKDFEMSSSDLKKAIKRFVSMFEFYTKENTVRECALVFPTILDTSDWVIKYLRKSKLPNNLVVDFESKEVAINGESDEYAERYYANVLIIKRFSPANMVVSCAQYM